MKIVSKLFELVKRGKQGKNIGVSTGCQKLDSIIYGIQRKYITVLCGDTGSGKSSAAIHLYVYQLLKNMINDPKLKIIYYSLELSSEVLFAKLLSIHIWDTYKVLVTYEEILSLTSRITEEKYQLIVQSEEWLNQVEKHLIVYDKNVSAKGIYGHLKGQLEIIGEFKDIGDNRTVYIPINPEHLTLVVVDHVGLLSTDSTIKNEIDKLCNYLVYLRNKTEISVVIVQQTNRESKAMDRKQNGYEMFQLNDLALTSSTAQAAEVVIGLYHPFREKINRCPQKDGYDIKAIGDRIRIFQVLKNRYGKSDVAIGINFFGEIGYFKELPKPEEITDYEIYKTIDYKSSEIKETSEVECKFTL